MSTITSHNLKDNSGISGAKLCIQNYKKHNRITGYKYIPKLVKEYKPKKPSFSSSEAHSINKVIRYSHILSTLGMHLFESDQVKESFFGKDLFGKLSNSMESEAKFANNELNICFYISSLMYLMLREESAIEKKHLKYVQGFLRTKTSKDYKTPEGIHVEWMFTTHAFVLYKGSVLDTTISQVSKYILSELDKPWVIGDDGYLADIFTYFGFEEHPQTATNFAKRFAKLSNMDFQDWLLEHSSNAQAILP